MPVSYTALHQALKQGQLVVVCWEPECRQHRLLNWSENEWVDHERTGDKYQYTHGICEEHAARYRKSIDSYFGKVASVA